MSNKMKCGKIISNKILDTIFNYIKDPNIKYKLFTYSRSFQQKLGITLFDYQKRYINQKKSNHNKIYINIKESNVNIFTKECDPNKEIKYLITSIVENEKSFLDDRISEYKKMLNSYSNDSIYSKFLEEAIQERNELSYDSIRLFYNGQELNDNKKFSEYNIIATDGHSLVNRSMLEMRKLYNLKVFVSIKNMEIDLLYFFKGGDSIKNLKEKISENENIPLNKMTLTFNDNIIRDETLFKHLNVYELYFKVFLEGEQIIEINLNEGNNCSKCKVDLFSSVYQNQLKMNKHLNYRLSFQGKLLNLRKLLIHYNIKNGDSLQLIKTDENILLKIEYIEDKYIKSEFHFDTNETLGDFRKGIYTKLKGNGFYIIMHGRRILDYQKKIKEFSVYNGMTVKLVRPIIGG